MVARRTAAKKAALSIIEVDLNDYEPGFETYDGDDPRPGFYSFECVNVMEHESQGGALGFKWIFVLRDNPLYEGWSRFVYSNMDTTKWKTEELIFALRGGNAAKGTKAAKVSLDPSNERSVKAFLKTAKLVRGRVQRRRDSDADEPEYELGRIIVLDEAKIAARKALSGEADDPEDESGFDDADEYDEDETDDDADDDSDEEVEEDDDEDEEDEDEEEEDDLPTEAELKKLSLLALKKKAVELEAAETTAELKGMDKDAIISLILEDPDAGDEDDEDDDEEDDDEYDDDEEVEEEEEPEPEPPARTRRTSKSAPAKAAPAKAAPARKATPVKKAGGTVSDIASARTRRRPAK